MAIIFFTLPFYAQTQNSESETEQSISSSDLEKSIVFSTSDNSPAGQTSPNQNKKTSGIGIFVKMILVLVIIVFLIYGIFWFIKKKSNVVTNEDDYLRRVAAINIAPGKSVQVVTLIDKAFLIGVTEDSITLLGEINDDELIKAMNLNSDKKSNIKKPATFAEVLDMFLVKTGKQKNVFSESEEEVSQMFNNENRS